MGWAGVNVPLFAALNRMCTVMACVAVITEAPSANSGPFKTRSAIAGTSALARLSANEVSGAPLGRLTTSQAEREPVMTGAHAWAGTVCVPPNVAGAGMV